MKSVTPASTQLPPQYQDPATLGALTKPLLLKLGVGDIHAAYLNARHAQALHDAFLGAQAPLTLREDGPGRVMVDSMPDTAGPRRLPPGFGNLAQDLVLHAPHVATLVLKAACQCQADTATKNAIAMALALFVRADDSVEADAHDDEVFNALARELDSCDESASVDDALSDAGYSDFEDADPVLGQTLPSRASDALETDEHGVQQLVAAIRGGPLALVRGLSGSCAMLNSPLEGGKPALHLAIEAGRDDVLELLLKVPGVDPNATDDDGWAPLHIAARRDRLDTLMLLVDYQADVLQIGHDGQTPLHAACKAGHVQVVEWMLSLDVFEPDDTDGSAACNAPEDFGATPLHHAVQEGRHGVVDLLLARAHLEPSLGDDNGVTPLHHASDAGNLEIANLLLGHEGVVVDAEDSNGLTPLFYAALANRWKVAELLLQQGADVQHVARNGNTLLLALCAEGDERGVRRLLKTPQFLAGDVTAALNAPNAAGKPPLQLAACANSLGLVSLLLGRNEVNRTPADHTHLTPLHEAAARGFQEVAELLLTTTTVDINCIDAEGFTPLHMAIATQEREMARYLADHKDKKTNLSKPTNTGLSPLHTACEMGDQETVKWLLPAIAGRAGMPESAVLQATTATGCTPLQMACRSGNVRLVRALLAVSLGQLNQADNEGWTPLLEAVQRQRIAIVKLLLQQNGISLLPPSSNDTPMVLAMALGDVAIARELRASGAEVHASGRKFSPLHIACHSGHLEAVEWLLTEIAALPNHQTQVSLLNARTQKSGNTPVHMAIEGRYPHIVARLLQEPRVDPLQPDWFGWTPLHWAAEKGDIDMVDLLLQKMPDTAIDTANLQGASPLHVAIGKNALDIAQCLLDRGADILKARKDGNTTLHIACTESRLETLKWVLLRASPPGATPPPSVLNKANQRGEAPLLLAAGKGRLDIVGHLLAQPGTAPHQPSLEGNTPLLLAARAGADKIVALLVQRSEVRVFDEGPHLVNVLQCAAASDNARAVIDILQGAMTAANFQSLANQFDAWGRTAQSVAIERGASDDVVAALKTTHTVLPLHLKTTGQPRGWVITVSDLSHAPPTPLLKLGRSGGIHMHALGDGTRGLAWRELQDLKIRHGDFVVLNVHSGWNEAYQTVMVDLAPHVVAPMVDVVRLLHEKGASKVLILGCESRRAAEPLQRRLQNDPNVRKPGAGGFPSFAFTFVGRDGPTLTQLNMATALDWIADRVNEKVASWRRSPAEPLTHAVQQQFTVAWSRKDQAWSSIPRLALTTDDLFGMKGEAARQVKEQLTFLHCADGNLGAVKELIETHLVSVHITMRPGVTLLHIAIENGHKKIVEFLLKYGADVDQPDDRGHPPINQAVTRGDLSLCKLLLRRGAAPDAKQPGVYPPLFAAIRKDQLQIARLLLGNGAHRDATLPDGTTLRQYAKKKGTPDMEKLLQ